MIPLYNKEATVARALRSVLQQSNQDFEIIVVNDGSTDASGEQAARFQDPRIRIIHQVNAGVSAARNRGIQETRANTVTFLDADDEWKPWFLEEVSALQRDFPGARVWATNYEFALSDGLRRPTCIKGLPGTDWRGLIPDYFLLAAQSHPPVHSSAISASRTAIHSTGGFPLGVGIGEDLLTWARLAARFPMAYCSRVSSTFRVTANETSCLSGPSRRPPMEDLVGQELQRLEMILEERQKRSLRLYLARWKRMRASMFARCGDIRHTIGSSFQAFQFNPRELIVWGFVGLSLFHWCRKLSMFSKPSVLQGLRSH